MRLDGIEAPKCRQFRYLDLVFQENGMIDENVTHKIKLGWLKLKSVTGELYDKLTPTKVKCKFYKMTLRSGMLYGSEWRASKAQLIYKMRAAKMRML